MQVQCLIAAALAVTNSDDPKQLQLATQLFHVFLQVSAALKSRQPTRWFSWYRIRCETVSVLPQEPHWQVRHHAMESVVEVLRVSAPATERALVPPTLCNFGELLSPCHTYFDC